MMMINSSSSSKSSSSSFNSIVVLRNGPECEMKKAGICHLGEPKTHTKQNHDAT